MGESDSSKNRFIQIKAEVVGPCEPRLKRVRPKRIGDYPDVPKVYLEVARNYSSPLLIGPPICDEFIALIEHMFTEEEASVVRHIKPGTGKTAAQVAAAEHRPVEEVRELLERLTRDKSILLSLGSDDKKRYTLMPVVPGTFEAVMMRTSMDSLTDWHHRFAELFEALWETGFIVDYLNHPLPGVRYLPVKQSLEIIPSAWPSDQLEEVLDRYNAFAVTLCQCRMTEEILGRGCGKPKENCTAFGDAEIIERFIQSGKGRRVEKKEILEIKAEAEANGLVSWMINEESGNWISCSCSCCGCCCHMMRTITEFNMPAMIAPPHFMPRFDLANCDFCAKCARACPMAAITVDMKARTHLHQPARCIGCGLCAMACDKKHAIQMAPVKNYKKPPQSYTSLIARLAPNALRNAWSGWRAH
jgi:electron transport complex protein RnfB